MPRAARSGPQGRLEDVWKVLTGENQAESGGTPQSTRLDGLRLPDGEILRNQHQPPELVPHRQQLPA